MVGNSSGEGGFWGPIIKRQKLYTGARWDQFLRENYHLSAVQALQRGCKNALRAFLGWVAAWFWRFLAQNAVGQRLVDKNQSILVDQAAATDFGAKISKIIFEIFQK